jgi:hypothetical protein
MLDEFFPEKWTLFFYAHVHWYGAPVFDISKLSISQGTEAFWLQKILVKP